MPGPGRPKKVKEAPISTNGNTLLWNNKPFKEISKDGITVEKVCELQVTSLKAEDTNIFLTDKVRQSFINLGFPAEEVAQMQHASGMSLKFIFQIRCKSGAAEDKDEVAPGQTSLHDAEPKEDKEI